MATSSSFIFCSLLLCLVSSQTLAITSFQPKALVVPVTKDSSTLQYTTQIKQRTPLVPIKLTIDVGGIFQWVDCGSGYVSSSYRPVSCDSPICKASGSGACETECYSPPGPGCYNNTCSHIPNSPFSSIGFGGGEMASDTTVVQSTDGRTVGKAVVVSAVVFTCGTTSLLEGLSAGALGMAGLGRSEVSLPVQFASAFKFSKKFAMCLSSSSSSNGVIFFGDGPYVFLPKVEVSKSLMYTPLILNPVSTAGSYFEGNPSTDYFINLTSIKINGKAVPLRAALLNITQGNGGTKISTVNPYTVMETSIFKAFVKVFRQEAKNLTKVSSVKPFKYCFSSKNTPSTRVGPAVPIIDLVMHSSSVYWRIFGANSMVQVKEDVICLGFVDGGSNPRTSIVIGGYQLEDNLVQIDLEKARLGFSSSLLFKQTTCSNFNFTSSA
ncbi:probable aspartic proteinase GIP2 [Syzygium oleosum]|uniref:probable aspartic proteinase GIP2 n=1 Tax=Syzygium oleosum TaxID=219896 RepID=UPI0024BAA45A|nr:probable aspartic proteinase GIP2 [Syzygium oleosum]